MEKCIKWDTINGGKMVRDPKRIKRILKLIEKLWLRYPDQRLGQLLFNYTRFGTRAKGKSGFIRDIFFYEDDDIEEDLKYELKC